MQSRMMPDVRNKTTTFVMLVATLLFAQLPLYPLLVFTGVGNWIYLCIFLHFGVMAILPFVLMKVAPEAAGFGRQWLPSGCLQWLGMLALIFLTFVVGGLAVSLTKHLDLGLRRPFYIPTITSFSRLTIVANGFLYVFVSPVVEEVFWRGYVLDQLRKLMHWALALPLHAAMFALVHFGFSFTFLLPMGAFFYGLVLGAWRIRFKSLLPLIVAHITINVAATAPILQRDYETLRLAEELQATGDLPDNFLADLRSNPKCQQISALTKQPSAIALPELIDLLSDDDDNVQLCAIWAITKYNREDVRPYLKEALISARTGIVEGALFLLSFRPDSALRTEVRQVAWSARDPKLETSAILTLHDMGDTDGLRKIAEGHPNKKARDIAKRFLQP